MIKMKKAIGLACFFILCLMIGNFAEVNSYAASGKKTDGSANTSGSTVKYSFDKKSGVLTISGKGEMPAEMTFHDDKNIKKVVIKKGVTSVSDYAFLNCSNLKKLKLPDGLVSIGVKSFLGTNIKKLKIPASVKKIGQQAFWNCKRLKWITMPGDFEFVYEENEPDEWIERLVTSKQFGSFAPKKITFTTPLDIKNVSLLSAKYLVVSADDPLYTSIDGVICSKDGKALVRIPSELKKYRVPEGVEKVYVNAWHYVYYLSDEEDQDCVRLEKLYFPKGKVSVEKKSDPDERFYLDPFDVMVIAKGTELDGRSIEMLTQYCFNPFIEEHKQNPTKWFTDCFSELVTLRDNGCMVTKDGMVIRYFGNGGEVELDDSITGIGSYAFDFWSIPRNYSNDWPNDPSLITGINIPGSVTYIGEYAFGDQQKLESVTIPASIKEVGRCVFGGTGLEKIIFEDGIEEIPATICANCGSLETVGIPSSVKKIGDGAFLNCFKFDIDGYSGFENLPELTEIGDSAFKDCKMKKFVIPERITKIGYGAFALTGDFGRTPEEAEILVMGDTDGYEINFCRGKAIPTYAKGLSQVKLGIGIWTHYDKPDKKGIMMIGSKWSTVGDIDGYEYEASVNEDFSGSEKLDTTETEGKVYVNTGSAKVVNLYARVRAYKVTDDKGTREYSAWSDASQALEYE